MVSHLGRGTYDQMAHGSHKSNGQAGSSAISPPDRRPDRRDHRQTDDHTAETEPGSHRSDSDVDAQTDSFAIPLSAAPPKFSRTPSALARLSTSSGNVLNDAELEHCETLAIPSSEVVVGVFIGRGACGDIMRGAWRGRAVAIKSLCAATREPGTQESKDMIKEISLMCRSFATVRHPAIVGFYGICTDGPQPWLIMEYVGGGSLEDYLASQGPDCKPTRRQALAWALDLARGLEYLHSQQPVILHRDIKPGNLMLTDCLEHLKLCDFGVSTTLRMNISDRESTGAPAAGGQIAADTLYNDDAIAPSARPKEMTGRTGTYRYMAPEVFEGETSHYDAAVDIYSAALSIWVIFHGKIPFADLDGLTVAELASRQMLRPPVHEKRATMLPGTHKAMPSSVSQLVVCAWHSDPSQRPSASDMIVVLEAALKKESAGMLSSISSAMRGGIFRRAQSVPTPIAPAARAQSAAPVMEDAWDEPPRRLPGRSLTDIDDTPRANLEEGLEEAPTFARCQSG